MERQKFMHVYDPPLIIKKALPFFYWNTTDNRIMMTFDDGPNPDTTGIILQALNKYGIKSLFFCVGNNVNRYSSLLGEILSEGHEIGNHTYNHRKLSFLGKKVVSDEIERTNSAAMDKFGRRMKFFRPPYGKFDHMTHRIAKSNGLNMVLWSLLTYDFQNNFSVVKKGIKKSLRQNSIIVLHDNSKSKGVIRDSIELIAEEASLKGYKFGTAETSLSKR
ncbi:MAG TPA: polysaccharide deacetylase family protein [Ignavibacteriales bacterium]|nr:polysaccharide deacetylase family protein [Ignavibacteriales bacterium]